MSMKFEFDQALGIIKHDGKEVPINSPEAFEIISKAWLRTGWDTKYVYGFTWLGRPIIQLPEDIIRIQEIIHDVQPDVIIETGVAHGGSLIFYASVCSMIGKGRIIGIDISIRSENRKEIERHRLSKLISLIEGNSIQSDVVQAIKDKIGVAESVLVILDSNHTKEHVLAELKAYSPLVSPGSYIVACDGIMEQVAGAPRSAVDWSWNNPISAINEFIADNKEFECVEPKWPFDEGNVTNRVTYWPKAFLRRNIMIS